MPIRLRIFAQNLNNSIMGKIRVLFARGNTSGNQEIIYPLQSIKRIWDPQAKSSFHAVM